ncbi:MAG: bifunctional glutamate N-acetyltransferase/amino-acid acetyltransferase ArgJ [Firmicutes bacterium]|nr:bifunctional glutamate N-acetyltransferase/amino-acid acetyltransferase ArgJ [Bacillota bacterium]
MNIIKGGVTAPIGFSASGVACGIKKDGSRDVALVCSDSLCAVSGVFTKNVVKGHSLLMTMEHASRNSAKAIVINSGNANACVGEQGKADAIAVASLTAELLNCKPHEVLFNSTGVIGQPLNIKALKSGIKTAIDSLSNSGGHDAAQAILTTDTVTKEFAVETETNGIKVRVGGMAKGSGMIHPNMATMIGVITTDINITQTLMDMAFKEAVNLSFNRISVDGDTSVCDMVVLLSNKAAGNGVIDDKDSQGYASFKKALGMVCDYLAKAIVKDGEGATKLVEIIVDGAKTQHDAEKILYAVAKSPLVKTAIFGEDANWGRIITAAGYSGAIFNPNFIDIYIGGLKVCSNGAAIAFNEEKAKKILSQKEITIRINLNEGGFSDKILTCDLSYDYIKINGSYRS